MCVKKSSVLKREKMEVEEQKKRIATEEEKRSFLKDQVVGDFLKGDNVLSLYIGRTVLVHMKDEDVEALLDRFMKTPEEEKATMYYTLNCLVLKGNLFDLEINKKSGEMKVNIKRMELSEEHILLQKSKKDPTIDVTFKHLSPPSKKKGGWPSKNTDQPEIEAYNKIFSDYPDFVTQGTRNGNNLAHAWEYDMSIDIAITKSRIAREGVSNPLMRVIVYEPCEDDQKGFDMWITPVKK